MEKYDQMVADLKSALKLNPFHANSHYMLAKLAKEEGQYTMAMLSYNTYLLIKPKDNLSFLSEYNEFLKGDSWTQESSFRRKIIQILMKWLLPKLHWVRNIKFQIKFN